MCREDRVCVLLVPDQDLEVGEIERVKATGSLSLLTPASRLSRLA